MPCHFVKNDASGIIYKAYENDGVVFPADATGAIEGQRMCRQWSGRQVFAAADRFSPYYQYSDTPSGTYFCVAQVDPRADDRGFAITLGVPFEHSRWFRGRETHDPHAVALPGRRVLPARRPPRWPSAGRAWRGRRPARTPTSCPRCRPAPSPASTTWTSTNSSTATQGSNRPAPAPAPAPAQRATAPAPAQRATASPPVTRVPSV